jgi:putative ABC transport system permease protein
VARLAEAESNGRAAFAAWRPSAFTLTGIGEPLRVNGQLVSSEFFPLLGVVPLLGRTISERDDRPNAPLVAVISYELWQRRFARDPNTIGRVVQFSARSVEIIGIMPAGFRFIYQDKSSCCAGRACSRER